MPPVVCRLRLRSGKPLGLAIYPKETFFSLPLEIRNKIYELLLLSPDPLAVFPPSAKPRFPSLTLGLLTINKSIAIEAAAVFYHSNTFKIEKSGEGHFIDCWNPLYSFLYLIGPVNRASLCYLELDISRPEPVSIDIHGNVSSRYKEGLSWMRKVHPRDQYTRIYPSVNYDPNLGPSVDSISPAIEAVFRLIGSEGSKLQLSLIMEFQHLPELRVCPRSGFLKGWSGEVPNFIEIMRRRLSYSEDRKYRVDVLWKGSDYKLQFEGKSKGLEKNGWDILEIADVYGPLEDRGSSVWGLTTCFTLRRKDVDPRATDCRFLD